MSTSKYRTRGTTTPLLVGLSLSYQRDHLLARGLGLEHLREMLLRLARPLLRQGANLAYGGHWHETPDNFTYDLLRLISAEQQDQEIAPEPDQRIGRLYNHSAWPNYLPITPRIEAQWINCCRIVRIEQAMADIPEAYRSPDDPEFDDPARRALNSAITLSAMRRIMAQGTQIKIPDRPSPERVPAVAARVLLGGKLSGYAGFLPGLFEEALLTLEAGAPLYILGGFGGAAEVLTQALTGAASDMPPELTAEWQRQTTSALAGLEASAGERGLPPGLRGTADALAALETRVLAARGQLAQTLNTGLSEAETVELMTSRDMRRVTQLVLRGLRVRFGLPEFPG